MKTLGYYNGKYDEIDKIMIPMSDRSIGLAMVYMMPLALEIIKSWLLMNILIDFLIALDY